MFLRYVTGECKIFLSASRMTDSVDKADLSTEICRINPTHIAQYLSHLLARNQKI